ncbi:MAG: 50S ribosomal protein L21 [Candidatus Cloacimonadia bacterium]
MYAIIDFQGRQFKVQKDNVIKVPYLKGKKAGEELEINKVLLIGGESATQIGMPTQKDAKVLAEVVDHGRDKKIIVFKKKRRKGYRKKLGHKQPFTKIKIKDIVTKNV